MPIIRTTEKRDNLLALKEKLLNDIKYYEKRIYAESDANVSLPVNFDDGSDSDDEPAITIETGPTMLELKSAQKTLQTGLCATQELSSLMVLQSQVDVMVDDPIIKGEPPVSGAGLWREVNTECRIDLVPFAATFYVHQANGIFGAKSYRCLKVLPVKPSQEVELARSVLARAATPSDAVEVLRNYSVSYRSRRTSLARLADRFTRHLHMEPLREGGYMLRCAGLLEVSWVLENKWSPVAPFYHKMVFNLENMDECYVKIIRQAHKQLGDPSTDTEQRTLLLAKIIATCLEVQGTQEQNESLESDTETNKIEKRRLTLENEAPEPKKMRNGNKNNETEDNSKNNTNNKENVDEQMMAPPKSLPKRSKPKGKENTNQNRKSVKRATVDNEEGNVKKARTDVNEPDNVRESENEKVEKENQSKSIKDNAKNKDKIVKGPNVNNNIDKATKVTEKEQVKTKQAISGLNQNQDNTENNNGKEDVEMSETQNSKPKADKNQIIVEKKPVKQIEKAKTTKSKNTVAGQRDVHQNKINNIQKSSNNEQIQEKPKNKVSKNEAQKPTNKDKNAANSKNDQIAKTSETKDKANDNVVTNSKNNPKIKNSKTQENKVVASSKNDVKTKDLEDPVSNTNNDLKSKETENVSAEENAKMGIFNTKLVEIDDIPIMSVNYNNIVEVPKRDNIDKTAKKQKVLQKTTNANEKGPNKKVSKIQNNAELTNKNKQSNAQNVKKPTVNKETKSNTNKATSNVASKVVKHLQKNTNKVEVQSGQKTLKNKENTQINKENKKTSAQKSKPKEQNRPNKNLVTKVSKNNEQNKEKTATNEENNPKVAKNLNQQTNVSITTITKSNNGVINNKEHITNKIRDGKPKMVIKNLSHKNFVASKKTKNLNISGKIKKAKANNPIIIGKENDSGSKSTKIPMKLTIHESLKKNPLRMSPRKFSSTFKSSSDSNMKQKYFTNIPRLMRKPEPKVSN